MVAGRYRLLRPLGRGGMGVVWHAHDTLLGRDVAVKEIYLPTAGTDPADPADRVLRRALREARAAAQLRHPAIITVHDVVTDDGRPWIVMELIDGRSLADAIRAQGLLSEQRAAEIGLRVLDALRAAHRRGILHRDVCPVIKGLLVKDPAQRLSADQAAPLLAAVANHPTTAQPRAAPCTREVPLHRRQPAILERPMDHRRGADQLHIAPGYAARPGGSGCSRAAEAGA
jgi:hypothetical protein